MTSAPHNNSFRSSREDEFWTWFQNNEHTLFNFERDQERVFNRLIKAMRKVHPDLVFEFGPIENNKREFVISAGGLKSAFPFVERLYSRAPNLACWNFTKFRPRRTPMEIKIGDIRVSPDDVEVTIQADGEKAGLTVYLRGLDKKREDQYLQAAFLLLDQAIGEYDMEIKVGFIEIKPFEQSTKFQRLNLLSLQTVFDTFMSR
ncbi:MAG: hypothetical protein A2Z74_02290 [Chloroflexi bacterium RBG_13_46_9]|nr:MAG: hypothetical protein A2Z74_02290 [Chloroflexi bacterium RBG_13_46_9]